MNLWLILSLYVPFVLDVLDIAWSPDDSFLASGSVDNTITIWNAQRFPGLKCFWLHVQLCYINFICVYRQIFY